jgi:predicted dehydrogenase
MNENNENIWLIGAGQMSIDYAHVLEALKCMYRVIGRGEQSALSFKAASGKNVQTGGLAFALSNSSAPETAIVAVGVEQLAKTATLLINAGTKYILLEKPGGLSSGEIRRLRYHAEKYGAIIMLAYNRRFYSSTQKALQLIKSDGGATSCNFEFTEWSHLIRKLPKDTNVKKSWFLGNSSHITDLAFFICGKPLDWQGWYDGKLDWHPSSSRFCGAGKTDKGILFSYHADWEAPGRWSIEVSTLKRKLIFRPIEELKETIIGSLEIKSIKIDDSLDKEFKPGLFRQTKAFLKKEYSSFCNISEQADISKIYAKMAGYDN